MVCYNFRLFLEYARVMSPNRTSAEMQYIHPVVSKFKDAYRSDSSSPSKAPAGATKPRMDDEDNDAYVGPNEHVPVPPRMVDSKPKANRKAGSKPEAGVKDGSGKYAFDLKKARRNRVVLGDKDVDELDGEEILMDEEEVEVEMD